MSMIDWNGDGKKDWQDEAMDYMVYKEVMSNNGNKDTADSCFSSLMLVPVVLLIMVLLGSCMTSGCNSYELEEYTTNNVLETTLYIDETTTEESITEDIPYVGMLEKDMNSTSLGQAHYYGSNNIIKSGEILQSKIYDYYDENKNTIFVVNVVNGRIYRVNDIRDNPWNRKKAYSNSKKKDKETTSVKKDRYGAENYDEYDYEDFYDDNYGDFEDIDEAADYLEEYWDEYE